jgi:hypothetical protein
MLAGGSWVTIRGATTDREGEGDSGGSRVSPATKGRSPRTRNSCVSPTGPAAVATSPYRGPPKQEFLRQPYWAAAGQVGPAVFLNR